MHTSSAAGEKDALDVNVYVEGEVRTLHGEGNGPIAAFVNAINELPQDYDVRVLDYAEHALSAGGDAVAAAYVECARRRPGLWGVGIDANIVTASLKAVICAVNRAAAGPPRASGPVAEPDQACERGARDQDRARDGVGAEVPTRGPAGRRREP